MIAREGLEELDALTRANAPLVRVYGADGAFSALVLSRIVRALDAASRPLVVITPDEERAARLVRDLGFFLHKAASPAHEGPRVLHLPGLETSPWADVSPDRRATARRMATLFRLSQGMAGDVLVASIAGLSQRVIPRAAFAELVDIVAEGEEIDREQLIALLSRGGYLRAPVVEDPGAFAVRGGVIDVFVPLYRFPLRIELLGDMVESLRFFEPSTQRTLGKVEEAYVHPVRETILTRDNQARARILDAADIASHPSSKTRAILDHIESGEDFFGIETLVPAFHARMASIREYLPKSAPLVLIREDEIVEAARELFEDAGPAYDARIEDKKLAFPPSEFFLDEAQTKELLSAERRIDLPGVEIAGADAPSVRFSVREHQGLAADLRRARAEKHEELLRPLVRRFGELFDEGNRVVLVTPSSAHAERLTSLLRGYNVTPLQAPLDEEIDLLAPPKERGRVELVVGALERGFELPEDHLAVLTESEIFGDKAVRERPKKARGGFKQDDFKHLEPGSYVVHTLHGVGVYRGLTKLPLAGQSVDFLHLEYDGGALYLPVWRVNEMTPYSGAEGVKPKVDRLGGLTWQKTKSRVTAEVKQMADELLQLYAQRKSLSGQSLALSAQSEQTLREFEATFPFEETPDQQKAIDDVLADLDAPRPMDRLVCGDVGYGKTEVAVRAALKCALAGRQAAILAPTTVLVEQHGLTFKSRYQDLPVKVASISRFSSKKEQTEVLRGLSAGTIDVVVGTHRLLSADVNFKQLGLIVVDEEQRFGVAHKERLKKLKTQVDVLTLTATPIPRTLHMALMGLREISIITTPPADRLAIRTIVCRYTDAQVTEALRRELARGGQIFFVHNRVEDIDEWAGKIRALVPEARVLVGHGQMPAEMLEKVMLDFVDGKADVLVCTTIIESGLDIGRANTMIVNHADRFGLAQLYQIRGRIGRSKERAYCYLMVPAEDALTPDAKARLQVLQRFTELGAGFQIASHDLEIRGAGDLLGAKQSGAIAAVGFETYTQLLEEAVSALKGEPIAREKDPELSCDLPGYIPEDFCPDVSQRLEFYRRFSLAEGPDELMALETELSDRYGPPPDEVGVLSEIMYVKSLGRRLKARAIELTESRLALTLADDTPLDPARVMKLVAKKGSPWKLTPEMRLQRSFLPNERDQRLQLAKALLIELLEKKD